MVPNKINKLTWDESTQSDGNNQPFLVGEVFGTVAFWWGKSKDFGTSATSQVEFPFVKSGWKSSRVLFWSWSFPCLRKVAGTSTKILDLGWSVITDKVKLGISLGAWALYHIQCCGPDNSSTFAWTLLSSCRFQGPMCLSPAEWYNHRLALACLSKESPIFASRYSIRSCVFACSLAKTSWIHAG